MFGKFMNNYYYGKSGKGDYTPEDLPKNRWQLFCEMLRVRMSALCRLNLLYVLPWLPAIIVVMSLFTNSMNIINQPYIAQTMQQQINAGVVQADGSVQYTDEEGEVTVYTPEQIQGVAELVAIPEQDMLAMQGEAFRAELFQALLLLIPCIFITGPWTAGVSYVTRNWARDEHAFIWTDLKDAMKENWKGALVISGITSVMPFMAYMCWYYYGQLANTNAFWSIPQMLTLMVMVVWSLAVTYMYPMLVTYQMSVKTVIRNSLILAIGRLPLSVGVRVLYCLPVVLVVVLMMFINNMLVPLFLLMYYLLIGLGLSRFITASYTNAVFDKFINSRIEGAKVNRGLAEEDDEDDEEEEEQERELKPWENGYADRDR